jgi:Fuc2NAc and GlcNAc transferase
MEPLIRTLTLPLVTAFCSLGLSYLALRYATARQIIDTPNERSSHDRPVPRGGGVAIAVAFFVALIWMWFREWVTTELAAALIGGGALVSWIGFMDDRKGVPAARRFLVHVVSASWAVFWLPGAELAGMGILGPVVAIIGIVWWINLYNFMDGIDGIAGGQALSVATFAGALLYLGGDRGLALLSFVLAGSAVGFLFYNWPPARIFMGDVGSGFLGFTFAVLALASDKSGALPLIYWVALSGVFVFDATVTLIRRMLRREPFWSAHRNHAYQRLVTSAHGHLPVTVGVLVLNSALALVVYLAVNFRQWAGVGLLAALLILLSAYLCIERMAPMLPQSRKLKETNR